MNGLELSRAFFEACGKPMLEAKFPELLPLLAAGLAGSGSECLGFDDDLSRDHDFEPGFCLFLPGEDLVDRRSAFLLERAYDALPREFMGVSRPRVNPVGGPRRGVIRMADFFREKTGAGDGVLTVSQWLTIPAQSLAEATGGDLFFDNPGEMTRIRESLSRFPEEIRRKRLAGQLLLMAQSGQYNYLRCLGHGEPAAAQLAAVEFVRHAMSALFLLLEVYEPYYKWSFRALRQLPGMVPTAELLEYLLTTNNQEDMPREKAAVMESIAADVIALLRDQGLTSADCGDLERHAYSVNDSIRDGDLRNLHILAAT